MTEFQRRLLSVDRAELGDPQNNIPIIVEFSEPVDQERLRAAFAEVVKKHTALRTRFFGSDAAEVVAANAFRFESKTVPLAREGLDAWVATASAKPIDLNSQPFESTILDHGDGSCTWFLNAHHAVTDARSSVLIVEQTAKAYANETLVGSDIYAHSTNPPPATMRCGELAKTGELYFPTDAAKRSAVQLSFGLTAEDTSILSNAMKDGLSVFSEDLSLLAMHATALCAWINKLTGQSKLSLGLLLHQRTHVNMDVIGPCAEVFPLTVECHPGDTFRTLYRRTADGILALLRNTQPGSSPPEPVDILINYLPNSQSRVRFGNGTARIAYLFSGALDTHQVARYQIHNFATRIGTPVRSSTPETAYVLDLKCDAAATQYPYDAAMHLKQALITGARSPDVPLKTVDLRTPAEAAVIADWERGASKSKPPQDIAIMLHDALSGQHHTVLSGDETHMSAQTLWQAAGGFARHLKQQGCHAGDRVCLSLQPSPAYVIAVFGSLLAGCSFVPLDQSLTAERRQTLLGLARPALTISDAKDVLSIAPADPDPDTTYLPDDEAYLLFTSGTSGIPKGVPISRVGLSEYLQFARDAYFEKPAVAPLFGNLGFDLTITSLFGPILSGGRLVTIPDQGPRALSKIAMTKDITWLKATPSHLEILGKYMQGSHKIETMVVGGEALNYRLVNELQAVGAPIQIFNEYGPTEAVVGCMIFDSSQPKPPNEINMPIGAPAPGVLLRIVDEHNNRVPLGIPGELLVARPGMMQGYVNDAPDPFVKLDSDVFYRTGDLVYLNSNTQAVFLGRKDSQLKIGGVRLEPEEIESALVAHHSISKAVVRQWSPQYSAPKVHCAKCGLPDNVPNVSFDDDEICNFCHDFDSISAQTRTWFKSPAQMKADIGNLAKGSTYDCLFLLSGGKDSTYALYRTVDHGHRPYVITLDNGYLSQDAKENIRKVVSDLDLPHEFLATSRMNTIFRESLSVHSNVCQGCFKTIYTLAIQKAAALGIRAIITGLSRGQLFETRLVPAQFSTGRFDPDAIDQAILAARKQYHSIDDTVRGVLDVDVLSDDSLLDRIAFLDFYRYHDVSLEDMLGYLSDKTPWLRPRDTGRSSNCLINVAGIHTHLVEQGYHNYAIPYAWDVRLGHKTRSEAIAELNDGIIATQVDPLLSDVGYTPSARQTLTAWVVLSEKQTGGLKPAKLRQYLQHTLPSYAIPTAFVEIDDIPLSANGKIDERHLPRPERTLRSSVEIPLSFLSPTEQTIVHVWETVLQTSPIGPNDSFMALGGDSLSAVNMIIALSERLGKQLPDKIAFDASTVSELAATIDRLDTLQIPTAPQASVEIGDHPPVLSTQEKAILFEQRSDPKSTRYNVCSMGWFSGKIDLARFTVALKLIADCHMPLVWNYAAMRRRLPIDEAVEVLPQLDLNSIADTEKAAHKLHLLPFDLENGPLLRCLPMTAKSGETVIAFVAHHIACDHLSFENLWRQLDACYVDGTKPDLPSSYAAVSAWQESRLSPTENAFWLDYPGSGTTESILRPSQTFSEPDGLLTSALESTSTVYQSKTDHTPVAVSIAAAVAAMRPLAKGNYVSVGLISSSRSHPDSEPLVGYFLNPLPLTIHCPPHATFESLLLEVTRNLTEVLPHRGYPFSRIVADRKDAGRPIPNLDVLVAMNCNAPLFFLGKRVKTKVLFSGEAIAPLTFFHELHDTSPHAMIEFSGQFFRKRDAQVLLNRFCTAIEQIIECPENPVLAPQEARQEQPILIGRPPVDAPDIIQSILAHVAKKPDAPAVVCGDATLSWRALDQQSAAIAAHLAKNGIGNNSRVMISSDRSVDVIAGILGILRSGASYVPVNANTPKKRRKEIVSRLGISYALLGQEDLSLGCATKLLGEDWGAANAPTLKVNDTDEAYVIFTSGSTGEPMGVPIQHGQLAASTAARSVEYTAPPTRFMLLSDIGFDSSVVGIFWTLATGGTLVVPTEAERADVDGLAALLAGGEISHTLCVPVLYAALLKRRRGTAWPSHIILAGDDCPLWLVSAHFDQTSQSALSNEFGPTEATVWASVLHYEASALDKTVGRPVCGTWLGILDEEGQLLPHGQRGQLAVGGNQVTSGYIGKETTNGDKFGILPDPPKTLGKISARYVLSGDSAVIENGKLVLLGRSDAQLNVNGNRIDAAEIEALVCASGQILHAVLAAVDLAPENAAHSQTELALVVQSPTQPDRAAIRAKISQEMPPYMVPTRIAWLPRFPTTTNEKIDRRATVEAAMTDLLKPETAVEGQHKLSGNGLSVDKLTGQILVIFQRELRNSQLTRTQSFFDAGGHSLMALNAVMAIEHATGSHLSTTQLYKTPTAEGLAQSLCGHEPAVLAPSTAPVDVQPPVQARPIRAAGGYRTLNIPLQSNGTRPPVFAIHNLGEDAAFFRHIAENLGDDQPFYCLGKPIEFSIIRDAVEMIDGKIDITAIATAYADEIVRMVPEGPLVIASICGGVPFGHATVLELARRGRRPALNIMLADWHAPTLNLKEEGLVTRIWKQRWNQLKRENISLFKGLPRRLIKSATLRKKLIEREVEKLLLRRAQANGTDLSPRLQSRKYIEDAIDVLHNFEHLPYDGPSVSLRSSKDPNFWIKEGGDLGWDGILSDWAQIKIEGFGLEFVNPPRVHETAARLREMIDRVIIGQHPFDDHRDAATEKAPEPASAISYRVNTKDYEISLNLSHENAVAMPRVEQRNWMLNTAVQELSEEVDDLARRAPEMITGGGMAMMSNRGSADLRPQEIMENWQIPLMEAMAESVCANGGDILEIGYGRGISAAMVQSRDVASHTVVDCNPHVIADARRWKSQFRDRDIRVIDAMWQDSLDQLTQYDGILFHTYPLEVEELAANLKQFCTFAEEFFPAAAKLLKPGGRFSYFAPERDSLSRRHQRTLHRYFDSIEIRLVKNLNIAPDSHDAHWFDEITCITATARSGS